MPVALSHYTNEELVTLAEDLVGETHSATLSAIPKVAPWLVDVDTAVGTFKRRSETPAPTEAAVPDPKTSLGDLDDLVDHGARALQLSLKASIAQAHSKGESALANRLRAVTDSVFDHGLAPIRASYLAQSGGVSRMVELARHDDIKDDVKDLSLNGESYKDLVDRLDAHNTRMKEAVQRKADSDSDEDTSPTPHALRIRLIRRLNRLYKNLQFAIIDGDVPDSDRANAALDMRRRLDAVVAARLTP